MKNISFYVALRYWRSKSADRFGQLVTNLASTGIVLGVMALILVLSIMNGLEKQQKENVLSTIPNAIVMPKEGYFSENEKMLTLPNFVQKSVPINTANVILQSAASVGVAQVIGIRSFADDRLLTGLETESFDELLPAGKFNVILGARLAEQLKLHIGDKVRLLITENVFHTPFGWLPIERLFTVSQLYYNHSEAANSEIFTNLTDLGRLIRIKPNQFQGYRLWLDDPFQITKLPQIFPDSQFNVNDWRKQKGEFFQAVKMEKNMMSLLVSLIVIVAISNIITSLSLMVVDKQGEIAILQTLGLTKLKVRLIFIYQGFLVGIVGTILGAILGIILTLNLDVITQLLNPNGIQLSVDVESSQIVIIITFSLLLSLLSTIYPAYRATKIEPAEALRYE